MAHPCLLGAEVFAVNREYDIFEQLPDGSVAWRGFVIGIEAARAKLHVLADGSRNEFFAIHTPTREIVERVNSPKDLTGN